MIPILLVVVVVVLTYARPKLLAQPPAVLTRVPVLAPMLKPVPPTALSAPAPWRATAARRTPAAAAVLALGRAETRHVLLSPLFGVVVLIAGLNSFLVGERTEFVLFNAFALGGPAAFWCGLVCYFAGHLAASRARRTGSTEVLAPAALDARGRALALAVPALAAAAVVLVLLTAGWVYWWDVQDSVYARPGVWHLLSTPMQVIGGFLFGVMLATWAPWRGVAPAGFFLLVAVHVILAKNDVAEWGAFVEYAKWPDQGGGFITLSPAWHLAYLALLSAMALVGTLVWLPGRRRGLLALGAVLTLGAAAAGLAQ